MMHSAEAEPRAHIKRETQFHFSKMPSVVGNSFALDSIAVQTSNEHVSKLLNDFGLKDLNGVMFTRNGTRFTLDALPHADPELNGASYWIKTVSFRVDSTEELRSVSYQFNAKIQQGERGDYVEIKPSWTKNQLSFRFLYEASPSVDLDSLQDVNMIGVDHIAFAVETGGCDEAKHWFEEKLNFYESEKEEIVITKKSGMRMITLKSYIEIDIGLPWTFGQSSLSQLLGMEVKCMILFMRMVMVFSTLLFELQISWKP
jgi:hypothetical protein